MNIKAVIHRHGFTMKEVAEALGIKPSTISSGITRGSVSPKMLNRIAIIIGADISEFYEDETSIPANAIDGGRVMIQGTRYRVLFVPIREPRQGFSSSSD